MLWKILANMTAGTQESEGLPAESNVGEITALLDRWEESDPSIRERLVTLLYPELKRIARAQMRRERPDHTLQATELVNEFYLTLLRHPAFKYQNRNHFYICASKAMRRLLVDHARAHHAEKRGGGAVAFPLETVDPSHHDNSFDLVELDELLTLLDNKDPRMAQIVELKFFGGLTNAEAGDALGIHERTVKRDWQFARAWLIGQLNGGRGDEPGGGMGES